MCDWLTDWLIVRRVSAGKCKQWAANGLYFEMALNNPYLLSVSLAWRDSHYCELRGDLWNVLLVAQQPLVGQGLLTVEVSRSYSDTPHSVGLDLYLTIHNIDNRQTSTSPVRFEPAIPVSERMQTHALDRAAAGFGIYICVCVYMCVCVCACVCARTHTHTILVFMVPCIM